MSEIVHEVGGISAENKQRLTAQLNGQFSASHRPGTKIKTITEKKEC